MCDMYRDWEQSIDNNKCSLLLIYRDGTVSDPVDFRVGIKRERKICINDVRRPPKRCRLFAGDGESVDTRDFLIL